MVAVIALLVALLLPALSGAMDQGRIATCGDTLHHIGIALRQYITDNHDWMMPYGCTDELSYEVLPHGIDGNGNPYDDRYGAGYNYHNLLAPYLGLGNCMPVENVSGTWWPQWDAWAKAAYSVFPQYQCPAGLNMKSPYGWACDPVNGGCTSGFYMQNASWLSQNIDYSWPTQMAYMPRFVDTSRAILQFEFWSTNGMTGDGDATAQPYTTHYKWGYKGVLGVGRSILYADDHLSFLYCGDMPDTPIIWNGMNAIWRANEMGIYFTSQYDGRQYIEWGLIRDSVTSPGGQPVQGLPERG